MYIRACWISMWVILVENWRHFNYVSERFLLVWNNTLYKFIHIFFLCLISCFIPAVLLESTCTFSFSLSAFLCLENRPWWNYFLNHHIKCSFHRSSTSFPLTNSQGEVEESNGLCFLSAYRLSRRGKGKRASLGARRAFRSDEGKRANRSPTRSCQQNIFFFLPCGPTLQGLISECKENVLPVTLGLTRARLSFCQFCLFFFGATRAPVCDIHI